MKILICTMAVVLLCSCSSIKNDGNSDGSQLSDNNPDSNAVEQIETSIPKSVKKTDRDRQSLYDLLAGRQRRDLVLLEEFRSADLAAMRAETDGNLGDYGFCLGEGWGVNPRSIYDDAELRRFEADAIASFRQESENAAKPTDPDRIAIEGSLDDVIGWLAKQAQIDYSIQFGIDVGTLKIPASIDNPIQAIFNICIFHDLDVDFCADRRKVFISKK